MGNNHLQPVVDSNGAESVSREAETMFVGWRCWQRDIVPGSCHAGEHVSGQRTGHLSLLDHARAQAHIIHI